MYKISCKVIKFIENITENWRVEQREGVKSLSEVKIQRGICQGDALSPLPFVIAMIPLNHELNERKKTTNDGRNGTTESRKN